MIFSRMFGEGFFANSIFLFTRWAQDEMSEMMRSEKESKTMDEFYEEFKVVLNENFRITVTRDQLVFIDNKCANKKLLEKKMI
jgi:hypothetical protein